jgi:hypothetical protein
LERVVSREPRRRASIIYLKRLQNCFVQRLDRVELLLFSQFLLRFLLFSRRLQCLLNHKLVLQSSLHHNK